VIQQWTINQQDNKSTRMTVNDDTTRKSLFHITLRPFNINIMLPKLFSK